MADKNELIFVVSDITSVRKKFGVLYNVIRDSARDWLKKERSSLMGDRKKDKGSKKGYRQILSNKKRKGRPGAWFSGIAGQFKGYVSKSRNINDIRMEAGLFTNSSKIKKGLQLLQTGGSYTTNKMMIMPIYKNLRKIGYNGPYFEGSAVTGMKNKAYRKLSDAGKLKVIIKNDKLYAYHVDSYSKRADKYRKSGLLFFGTKQHTVKKTLTGKYDLIHRFNSRKNAMMTRGQNALNRAIKRLGKGD